MKTTTRELLPIFVGAVVCVLILFGLTSSLRDAPTAQVGIATCRTLAQAKTLVLDPQRHSTLRNGVAHLEPVDWVAVDEVHAYVGGFVTRTGALLCSARRGEPITPRLECAFPPGLVYGNVGIDGFALDPRNNGGLVTCEQEFWNAPLDPGGVLVVQNRLHEAVYVQVYLAPLAPTSHYGDVEATQCWLAPEGGQIVIDRVPLGRMFTTFVNLDAAEGWGRTHILSGETDRLFGSTPQFRASGTTCRALRKLPLEPLGPARIIPIDEQVVCDWDTCGEVK